jgi:hypothetical protein
MRVSAEGGKLKLKSASERWQGLPQSAVTEALT